MILAVLVMFGAADLQAAGMKCAPRERMIFLLLQRFKEQRKSIGLMNSKREVMELYTSHRGTWTITKTNTKGITCVVEFGTSFEHLFFPER